MSKYRTNQRYKSTFSFIDLLFNLTLGFVFLLMIAIVLINPISKKKIIDPKTQLVVMMQWPRGDPSDIDLWIKHDKIGMVSFITKDNGSIHLDRDDVGMGNDQVILNGVKMTSQANQEMVSLRQLVPGHYIINIHWYEKHVRSKDDNGPPALNVIPVGLQIIQIDPYKLVMDVSITLTTPGQEKTVLQFDIDDAGQIDNLTTDQHMWVMPYVQTYRGAGDTN